MSKSNSGRHNPGAHDDSANGASEGNALTPITTSEDPIQTQAWTDTRLVKECIAGNEEAWTALLEKYKALIYSIPVKYGMPPHEAADVFQAVCMELLTSLPRLREPRALPKWLIQVTHHLCYRWRRQEQRSVSRDSEAELPDPQVPAVAESLLHQSQQEQGLREAIVALTPRCRRLIEALFFETPARPYHEIATELGLAVGSVGFNRQNCIQQLRRRLERLGFHSPA